MTHINEGLHIFTCYLHVYPQMEWAIPDFSPQLQRITMLWLVLIFHSTEGTRLSWTGCLVCVMC